MLYVYVCVCVDVCSTPLIRLAAHHLCSTLYSDKHTYTQLTHKPPQHPHLKPINQAEGEDVVSGVRTPHSLDWLQSKYPEVYKELDGYQKQLELHYRDVRACVLACLCVVGDPVRVSLRACSNHHRGPVQSIRHIPLCTYKQMQDLEFTVEDRKLYMLQTRNGKRTAKASVQIAVDMVKEGLVSEKEGKRLWVSCIYKCTHTRHTHHP